MSSHCGVMGGMTISLLTERGWHTHTASACYYVLLVYVPTRPTRMCMHTVCRVRRGKGDAVFAVSNDGFGQRHSASAAQPGSERNANFGSKAALHICFDQRHCVGLVTVTCMAGLTSGLDRPQWAYILPSIHGVCQSMSTVAQKSSDQPNNHF